METFVFRAETSNHSNPTVVIHSAASVFEEERARREGHGKTKIDTMKIPDIHTKAGRLLAIARAMHCTPSCAASRILSARYRETGSFLGLSYREFLALRRFAKLARSRFHAVLWRLFTGEKSSTRPGFAKLKKGAAP